LRYLIKLAYNGTNYHGWQKQINARSVQQVLEEKLSLLLGTTIETLGCGRTDTGVHAKDFYAHFDFEDVLNTDKLVYKLNQILPADVVVENINEVKVDFNARFDATSRTYEYWITAKRNPFLVELAWYRHENFDVDAMNRAAQLLIGAHDFECFSKVKTQVNNFRCHVIKANWHQQNDCLIFTITANRFLRNMVRAIVGTLIEVGRNKLSLEDFEKILASKNRCEAGQSVPAKGLFLTKVEYPKGIINT